MRFYEGEEVEIFAGKYVGERGVITAEERRERPGLYLVELEDGRTVMVNAGNMVRR